MPGVFDYICHKDIRGSNKVGAVITDEDCFAKDEVEYENSRYSTVFQQVSIVVDTDYT